MTKERHRTIRGTMAEAVMYSNNRCMKLMGVSGEILVYVDDDPPLQITVHHGLKIYFNLVDKESSSDVFVKSHESKVLSTGHALDLSYPVQYPLPPAGIACSNRKTDPSAKSSHSDTDPVRIWKQVENSVRFDEPHMKDSAEDDMDYVKDNPERSPGARKWPVKANLASNIKEEPISDEMDTLESLAVTFESQEPCSPKDQPSSHGKQYLTKRQLFDHAVVHNTPKISKINNKTQPYLDSSMEKACKDLKPCNYCGEQFGSTEVEEEHYRGQTPDAKCLKCGSVFSCLAKLLVHDHIEHSKKGDKSSPDDCPVCSEHIKLVDLVDHVIKCHTKELPYKCCVCGKLYCTRGQLNDHAILHINPDIDKVNQTLKIITKTESDSVTSKADSSKKIKPCINCEKHHKTSEDKEKHHQVQAPCVRCPKCNMFTCEICGKQCNRRSNLKIHMRIHSDLKVFTCHICKQGFNHKVSLRGHLKSKHNTELTD